MLRDKKGRYKNKGKGEKQSGVGTKPGSPEHTNTTYLEKGSREEAKHQEGRRQRIVKPVDLNVAYFGFDETESAKMGMRLTMQQLIRKQV